jgi:hypothetical protein
VLWGCGLCGVCCYQGQRGIEKPAKHTKTSRVKLLPGALKLHLTSPYLTVELHFHADFELCLCRASCILLLTYLRILPMMVLMDALPVAVDSEPSPLCAMNAQLKTPYPLPYPPCPVITERNYLTLSRNSCTALSRDECGDALSSRRNVVGDGVHAKMKLASSKTSEQGS